MIRPDRDKLSDNDILDILNNGDDSEIKELANDDDVGDIFCHEDIQLLEGNLYLK